jgi:hypothetical protein
MYSPMAVHCWLPNCCLVTQYIMAYLLSTTSLALSCSRDHTQIQWVCSVVEHNTHEWYIVLNWNYSYTLPFYSILNNESQYKITFFGTEAGRKEISKKTCTDLKKSIKYFHTNKLGEVSDFLVQVGKKYTSHWYKVAEITSRTQPFASSFWSKNLTVCVV